MNTVVPLEPQEVLVENPNHLECSICLQEITVSSGKMTLGCRHEFHPNCIAQWFAERPTNQKCPYCIQAVSGLSALPVIIREPILNKILRILFKICIALFILFLIVHSIGTSVVGVFKWADSLEGGSKIAYGIIGTLINLSVFGYLIINLLSPWHRR